MVQPLQLLQPPYNQHNAYVTTIIQLAQPSCNQYNVWQNHYTTATTTRQQYNVCMAQPLQLPGN